MVVNRLAELLAVPADGRSAKKLEDPRVSPYTPVPVAVDVPYDDARVRERAPRGLPGRAAPSRVAIRQLRATGTVGAHVLGYVGEINEEELTAQPQVGALRARRHDRQGRGRAHLRVRPARRRRAPNRVEVDSAGRVLRTISSKAPQAGPRRASSRSTSTSRSWPRTRSARGSSSARADPGQERQEGRSRRSRRRPARSWCSTRPTGPSSRWRRTPSSTRTGSRTGSRRRPGSGSTTRPSNYPLVDRAISGQYAPGSTFKLITAIAGLQQRRDHGEQDDRRRGQVRVPDRPRQLLHERQRRPVRPGEPGPRAHGVERRVLLHDRRRPLLPPEARAPGGERAAGDRPRSTGSAS